MDSSWSRQSHDVLANFKVNERDGLSDTDVTRQRALYGKNEIPAPPGESLLKLILSQFEDLLVLILLGAAIISFILALFEDSENRLTAFVEPAVILIILICNAAVGVWQETNAEQAIASLKASEARDANVIRNGGHVSVIHSSELVPGDIIVVAVGDKVPADARLISLSSATMQVDQAMLTGEAEAVDKFLDVVTKQQVVNQDKTNMLFSGTLVVRGKGTAVVVQTGGKTEMGNIATDLSGNDEKTPLQQKLDEFGEQLSKVIGVICIVVWLINIGHFTDPSHGSWVKGAIYYFKIAVALAVAAIPEGLPAVVTTCLALGTMKMAKKNAIVRSLPSVETLGCTTVICSDKTGTLTTNMMSVQKVLSVENVRGGRISFKEYTVEGDSFTPIGRIQANGGSVVTAVEDAGLAEIGKISALCNEATLSWTNGVDGKEGSYGKTGAATEAALLVLAEKIGVPEQKTNEQTFRSKDPNVRATSAYKFWSQVYRKDCVFEFDRDRKSMSVLTSDRNNEHFLFAKGAPESVVDRCTHIRGADGEIVVLTKNTANEIREYQEQYAREGLRCLALAEVVRPPPIADVKNSDKYIDIESRMTFVGLVSMLDPPRAAVNESIRKCRTAGIKVVVITGDNKVTAESICRRIGLFSPDEDVSRKSFTGAEFENMSESAKADAARDGALFSRVEPKHKLELVSILKAQGQVVAMTGDGVNDATALKKADIGIAMGSGTDVAREASDMVLQDDNFATIVMAVEEGRAIYANTKQFIRYLISSNIGEVACIFLTAALGMPEALIPVQLLWVNLVTDGLPATALGFNPPDKDIMQRLPRGRTESIINGWMFFRYVVIGVYVGIGTVGGFIWWYLYATNGPHITWSQLINFHSCPTNPTLYQGLSCDIFHDARPSTMSLSILVTIEMFNALNALSENQSLINVTPTSNPYVVMACLLSFALHIGIVYIPFFATIFHVAPLNSEEWLWVLWLSLPVFLIDEILKAFSRQFSVSDRDTHTKKNH